ncbi:hypothetical protein WJX74_000564 [Apatococcus lobatus]|uniref:Nucleotide-diphospho-sugar transferase domain-containing protein n=1 Tax=Apatococcus lobatus TaxID=904363 RepID=A0AAW1QWP8_9CHLO
MRSVIFLTVLTTFISSAFQQGGEEPKQYPEFSGKHHSGLYLISNENYAQIAAAVGSDQKEIVMTTISFHHDHTDGSRDQLDMMKNLVYFLHQSDRLQNTLIVSYDKDACQALHDVGILCFMDQAAPQPSELSGQYGEGNHPHWFSKYWHAHQLNKLGYTVLFVDNDAVVLQDPFKFHDRQFDIEGAHSSSPGVSAAIPVVVGDREKPSVGPGIVE